MTKSFSIKDSNFFISLFNNDGSSGTMSYKSKKWFIELDVKHAYDWRKESYWKHKENDCTTIWLPIRFGCAGWRIILKKKQSEVTAS